MALGCLSELVADTSSPSALTHDIGANELEAIRTELSRGAGKLYASHALLIDSERAARASTLLRGWHQLTSVRQARSSKLSHANVAATGRQILAAYAVVSPSSPSLLPVAAPAGADAVDPALLHSLARTALAKELLLKGGRPVTTTSGAHYPRRLLGSARADGDLIDDLLARLGHVSPAKPDLQLGDQLSAALDIAIAFQLEGDHWPIDVVAALCVLAQGYGDFLPQVEEVA